MDRLSHSVKAVASTSRMGAFEALLLRAADQLSAAVLAGVRWSDSRRVTIRSSSRGRPARWRVVRASCGGLYATSSRATTMRTRFGAVIAAAFLTTFGAACHRSAPQAQSPKSGPPPTPPASAQLQNEDGQWLMAAKDYANTRFSGLAEIT